MHWNTRQNQVRLGQVTTNQPYIELMNNQGYYDPSEFGGNQIRQPLNQEVRYVVRDPYADNNDCCCSVMWCDKLTISISIETPNYGIMSKDKESFDKFGICKPNFFQTINSLFRSHERTYFKPFKVLLVFDIKRFLPKPMHKPFHYQKIGLDWFLFKCGLFYCLLLFLFEVTLFAGIKGSHHVKATLSEKKIQNCDLA